jgi:hypothetical protein
MLSETTVVAVRISSHLDANFIVLLVIHGIEPLGVMMLFVISAQLLSSRWVNLLVNASTLLFYKSPLPLHHLFALILFVPLRDTRLLICKPRLRTALTFAKPLLIASMQGLVTSVKLRSTKCVARTGMVAMEGIPSLHR